MHVLFISAGGAVGGAEQSLLLLLRALGSAGIERTVALFEDGPFRERLEAEHVRAVVVVAPPAVRNTGRYSSGIHPLRTAAGLVLGLMLAWRLWVLARRLGADVIHTNGLKAHVVAGLAGRLAGLPVVWHVRDFPPPGWPGKVLRWLARFAPSRIITNSNAVRDALGDDGAPILALHNPVDLETFSPRRARGRLRGELGLTPSVPLVGLVAHLTPWKGHELFLETAARVSRTVPDARFLVVGGAVYATDGHAGYADRLRETARRLGLGERVIFLGARDDVADVLADLDVLVHCPTSPEPFGRVIAEALASGTPVVAVATGGIPELIEHETTGLLIRAGDADALAEATLRLLQDRAFGARLAEAGRRRAESLFMPGTHAAEVLGVYRTLPSH